MVIQVRGRIDGINAQEFDESLNETINESDKAIVLNLENLLYISSAGLRSILLIAKALKNRGAKFALCSLPDSIMEIVKIAGFDKIIDVYGTEAPAIDAVKS